MTTGTIATQVSRLADVVTPERDEKRYRRCRLANGIEALLVADATLCALEGGEEDARAMEEDASNDGGSDADRAVGEFGEDASGEDDEDGDGDGEDEDASGGMKLAACSIAFDVGYFADSDECDGLSHFLEHMVFMGSEKFPGEN